MKANVVQLVNQTELLGTLTSVNAEVAFAKRFCVFGQWNKEVISAAVLASATDIDATTNLFTKTSHGFRTGLKGQFTTSDTLPTGISAVTDYFIIRITDNTFKVATSLVNALAGTAVDITDVGVGNQTFTPTIAAASAYLEACLTDPNDTNEIPTWFAITTTETISASGIKLWEFVDKAYHSIRVVGGETAGQWNWDILSRIEGNGI